MTSLTTEAEDEFLAVARQAVQTSPGDAAPAALGLWDLLGQLDDPDARTAVFSFFRAHGGGLGGSSALGGLLAQPFLAQVGAAPGSVVATVRRERPGREAAHVVVGDPAGRPLLVDRPGSGAAIVEVDRVDLRPVDVPGRLVLHEVDVEPAALDAAVPEQAAAPARARSTFLGRLAIAMEILGAAERILEIATGYAGDRRQFGQPIGSFQAVRHLLAWGRTDCVAVEAVAYPGVRLDGDAPPLYGEVVKAIAGRNGRRTCERTLQVLGGIGFTAEHDHHHFHSRVLALDALLGTSNHLVGELGRRVRTAGSHPGFPAALLLPGAGTTPL